MNVQLQEVFKRHAHPLEPIPTDQPPVLSELPGVRAVLFDIYGTLLVSASGDVGTATGAARADAFTAALRSAKIDCADCGDAGVQCFLEAIGNAHRRAKTQGVEYPEVVITDVWRETLAALAERGLVGPGVGDGDLQRIAVQYEARINPTWPMPHMKECLSHLHGAGIPLGIISNAQFFTLELFPALTGQSISGLGFQDDLQYYSYRHQQAKPGEHMYRLARQALADRGIRAADVLYIGNDMLNDVLPAHKVGFRTALFAGDARSLRLREDDPRVAGVDADVILTDLADLGRCLKLD